MRTHHRWFFTGSAVVCAFLLCGCPAKQRDPLDEPAAAQFRLQYTLGSLKAGGKSYSIMATQPISSALTSQRLQLASSGMAPELGSLTRFFTIRTGKQRTVEYMCGAIHEILAKFLSTRTPDTVIREVGDFDHGDGVRFIALSPDVFRYDTHVGERRTLQSISLTKADIQSFDQILMKALKLAP